MQKNMKRLVFLTLCSLLSSAAMAQLFAPCHLMTDLLEHTDRVWCGGYDTNLTLAQVDALGESEASRYQCAEIASGNPMLGWQINSDEENVLQTAYQVMMATRPELLQQGKPDMWDSGRIQDGNSCGIAYKGKELQAGGTYYWTVRVWDNHGHVSPWSYVRAFHTAKTMNGEPAFYPLQKTDEYPTCTMSGKDHQFIDFGKATFGQLSLTLYTDKEQDTVIVHLGEKEDDSRVDRKPGGSIRYARYTLPIYKGTHTYHLQFRHDGRNTDLKGNESNVVPILMPEYIGEVFPFRYCEVEGYHHELTAADAIRHTVTYPFDKDAASFTSSDKALNDVWELCKHSIRATTFCGIYVDGDRERIPYEADAYINQLGHYCTDREYSMARRTVSHLLSYPTWPTEWILQGVLLAWHDYLYTGDDRLLRRHYDLLCRRSLPMLQEKNGLISTRTGLLTTEAMRSVGFRGNNMRDIVDWPQSGAAGLGKEEAGEADGFEMTEYNAVVNAWRYWAVRALQQIATVLGKDDDAERFCAESKTMAERFHRLLFDRQTQCYKDGVSSFHHSLHANMFPLASNLVPERCIAGVARFTASRGMACSVYGAQFLLDGLYNAGDGQTALSLLCGTGKRSWRNMMDVGSTITLEAWDKAFKPNLDWNHAWGAAPANIIPRRLIGVEPLEPAFRTFRIKPQPGSLEEASATVPCIRGSIGVHFCNTPTEFTLQATVPANSEAELWLPRKGRRKTILLDGKTARAEVRGGWLVVKVGSGKHEAKTSK